MISVVRLIGVRGLGVRISAPVLNSANPMGPVGILSRNFGVVSAIQDKFENKQKSETLKQFKTQMNKMLDGPAYSLASWGSELDEIMSSWRMKIPGTKSAPEVQRVIKFQEILKHMTPEEKNNPLALLKDEASMARIGALADSTGDDVRMFLNQFKSLGVYQQWLQARRRSGKRMPRNTDDMQALMAVDMKQDQVSKQRARMRRF